MKEDKPNFEWHYIHWREVRIKATIDYYGADYFRGKTLLEPGCGWGHVGNEFYKMGAIVTVSDARKDHIITAKNKHPDLNCLVVDSESCQWDYPEDKYDILIHWGLLYHLQNPGDSIRHLSMRCKDLVLESEVADCDDPDYIIYRKESDHWGMAYSGTGCLPSYGYVERCLTDSGFKWERLKTPGIINSGFHHYDWKRDNSKKWKSGQRAFWFCRTQKK